MKQVQFTASSASIERWNAMWAFLGGLLIGMLLFIPLWRIFQFAPKRIAEIVDSKVTNPRVLRHTLSFGIRNLGPVAGLAFMFLLLWELYGFVEDHDFTLGLTIGFVGSIMDQAYRTYRHKRPQGQIDKR